MKQDHTEESILHTDGEQNTGNHKVPQAPDAKGVDTVGGTRSGAENVEPPPVSELADETQTGH